MASSPTASSIPTIHRETENEVKRYRSSTDNHYHQVFINHRGPDVKKNFASYLYRRLISHGLKVFLDQPEMQGGENITSQIEGAIRSASVHVAIFSPGYAESKWCLNELLLMIDSGSTIIPVFHHVKPSDLRWTQGENSSYGKSLHDLEIKKTDEKLRYDSATIDMWRNALLHVAEISGFELEACNGDEGELLDKVVKGVLKKIEKTSFKVAKYPYGVDEKVKDFETTVLLQQQSGKPQVVGIVGLGGVGKTTLAKELFNRKSSHYNDSCFLSNAREHGDEKSVIFLQKKLFQSLTGSDLGTDNIHEAIERFKRRPFQALIILDDVDHVNQVDAVLTFQIVLSSDSLILITSRDRDVLTGSGVQNSSIYNLSGLNTQQSRELFCSHAFGRRHPLPGFESLVDGYLKACDGLPLSLKVLGADLFGKNDRRYWENYLDRLQQILPYDIQKILKISYDRLDREEKEIFLDIASFFIGEKMDRAIRIWDGSGWKGWLSFQNLQNKSLVEVDSDNKIKMHDHLRDIGRTEASGLPRRFWRWTENTDGLQLSKEQVRGIRTARDHESTEVRGIKKARDHESWYKRSPNKLHIGGLQLLDVEDGDLVRIMGSLRLPKLIWLRWRNCSSSFLPACVPKENLRVLEVNSSVLKRLWKGKSQAPLQLRELVITSPLSKLPKSTGQLKHLELIIIKCPSGNLKTLPDEFCQLQSLKSFELTDCSEIKSLPDSLGLLTNLEHIDLSCSKKLQSLPNSFGDLIRLKYLDLSRCINLTISSKTLGNISTLEYINLSDCKKIVVLPPQVAHQRSLEKLYCPFLEMVPSPLCGNLKELKLRYGSSYKKLKYVPIPVELLAQLAKLTVNECVFREWSLEKDEEETGTSRLKQSRGERTLSNLSSSIDMSRLLQLQHVELYKTEISEISFAEGFCPSLQHLFIRSCIHLVKVGTLPNSLIKLELTSCSKLTKIEGLCGLAKLQMLNIKWCNELEELSSTETLVSLEVLDVGKCTKLKRIERLAQLTELRRLDIAECCELEELPGVEHLKSLKWLDASGCPKLRWGEGVVKKLRQRQLAYLGL